MNKSVVVLVCMAMVMMGMQGCGKKASEKMAEGIVGKVLEKKMGAGAKVNIQDGKVEINTEKGSLKASEEGVDISTSTGNMKILSGEAAAKAEFPKDVYKYANATVVSATLTAQGQNFILETDAASDEVFTTYKTDMENLGWKVTMSADEKGEGMMMLKKKTKIAQVAVGKDDEKTSINIIVTGTDEK